MQRKTPTPDNDGRAPFVIVLTIVTLVAGIAAATMFLK